jgi:broad specificity phosphatase PhoE
VNPFNRPKIEAGKPSTDSPKPILLAGHGTIISLVLHQVDPIVDLDFHLAMPNPAIYELEFSKGRWTGEAKEFSSRD